MIEIGDVGLLIEETLEVCRPLALMRCSASMKERDISLFDEIVALIFTLHQISIQSDVAQWDSKMRSVYVSKLVRAISTKYIVHV